jgi:spore coat protein CotF
LESEQQLVPGNNSQRIPARVNRQRRATATATHQSASPTASNILKRSFDGNSMQQIELFNAKIYQHAHWSCLD